MRDDGAFERFRECAETKAQALKEIRSILVIAELTQPFLVKWLRELLFTDEDIAVLVSKGIDRKRVKTMAAATRLSVELSLILIDVLGIIWGEKVTEEALISLNLNAEHMGDLFLEDLELKRNELCQNYPETGEILYEVYDNLVAHGWTTIDASKIVDVMFSIVLIYLRAEELVNLPDLPDLD